MKIHILDMGMTKYGDCLVIEKNDKRILIDGGHPGDANSIRTQLKKIFGTEPPYDIDLLVVTHCHSDHIGCLPDLVALKVIAPKQALVADEKFGFGRAGNGDGPQDAAGLSKVQKYLIPALTEEDRSDMDNSDLLQFVDDAATLESKYNNMLDQLAASGISIHRYGRDLLADDPNNPALIAFEQQFADFGLKILGPTQAHLLICADAINGSAGDMVADSAAFTGSDDNSLLNTYRALATKASADAIGGVDMPGTGAAKNNQSIVLTVESDGWKALLAGDMQFAKAEIAALNPIMPVLLDTAAKAGPFDFVKLTHHTSYNGLSEAVYQKFKDTNLFVHTGGRHDPGHPDGGALQVLKSHSADLQFARNDRNGLITLAKNGDKLEFTLSDGSLNDFSLNTSGDQATVPPQIVPPKVQPAQIAAGQPQFIPAASVPDKEQFVEVITRVPHTNTKVTVTIDVQPGQGQQATFQRRLDDRPPDPGFAPGRILPKLIVVSNFTKLAAAIGQAATSQIRKLLGNLPQLTIIDLTDSAASATECAAIVNTNIDKNKAEGVLIIGGYDIVPPQRLDVLDAALRNTLIQKNLLGGDADQFIVWSDDLYADPDHDGLPELPVSRIPDAGDGKLILAALAATDFSTQTRFGIRNYSRPFAEDIFSNIPGTSGPLNISQTFGPPQIMSGAPAGAVYYMLHGSDRDGSRFWGETMDGDEFEAICIRNIPGSAPGTIVFTGCCWGALTVNQPASGRRGLEPLTGKTSADSIALAYLAAGAQAFIGCTGSHYSPLQAPYNYFGKPMHDHFWQGIAAGLKPAQAIFQAKVNYARELPHGREDPFSQAVELKIMRQYTCLGIGW